MVELRYWDYLAVNLTAGQYDSMVFDRKQDFFDRNTQSIFLEEKSRVCQTLFSAELSFVVLVDDGLKQEVRQLSCLKSVRDVGRWTIYRVVSSLESAGFRIDEPARTVRQN